MLTTKSKQDCSGVCNLEFCEQNICDTEFANATQIVQKTNTILSTDHILVLRNVNNNGQEVYKAAFNDLDPDVALFIMEKAIQVMSRTDPADGKSLWLDEGFIRVASGDPALLGTMAPSALQKSLKETFKFLPKCDPGDGSPWLNGGVLMQGSGV